MRGLSLGIDLGTSGIRSAVLDAAGRVLSSARAEYGRLDPARINATAWWSGVSACLMAQVDTLRKTGLDPQDIQRIGVDGTSGSMVLTDAKLRPVSRALMYNTRGFDAEAKRIATLAPDPHITRGSNSALARALALHAEAPDAVHLLHQADFITAKLLGRGGYSDYNNALKIGFDPDMDHWPEWIGHLGLDPILPTVLSSGAEIDTIDRSIAAHFDLSTDVVIHAGTTDSIAAFLAAAPMKIGAAVTSLGTTLAVKILSNVRVDDPEIGLYSHRLGKGWLVGGASNTGGGVLRHFFDDAELVRLSSKIDPEKESYLDYYPLIEPGERFPINDPSLQPRLTPRPHDNVAFLNGLLEGIARIEHRCYDEIAARGAPYPYPLLTAGGGAKNEIWTAIRARRLGIPIKQSEHSEASIGVARLVSQPQS